MTRLLRLLVVAPACLFVACDAGTGPAGLGPYTGFARAYGIWTPGAGDTCPVDVHNRYAVVGPDHMVYPTWHPPVDPTTGCTLGHEHGRDPRGSDLYARVGPIPFGYANEALIAYDSLGQRHEDHVGHKIEWQNDVSLSFGSDVANALFNVKCDVLTKLHQGTHSKDAFTNNLHELAYHIDCTDGTELHVTILSAIGTPGEFERSCDGQTVIAVGPATPANSPDGGGVRLIPDRACIDQYLLVPAGLQSNFGTGLRESWETSNSIRREDGHSLAFFNPYFQAFHPSRFYDPARPDGVGRTIDVCYEQEANGDRAAGELCDESTGGGTILGLPFNDPRSLFNGVRRVVDINDNRVSNADGPELWYTDPFGKHARRTPFPGSIRQFIARLDNERGDLRVSGPTLGRGRDYGGSGVHAPN